MEQIAATHFAARCREQAVSLEDLDAVLRLHRLRVFRFILVSLRDREAAETLTQDCFLKAYQARERFRNECSLETWLMHIAVNLIRDYVRNRRIQFWRRTNSASASAESIAAWLPDGQCSPEMSAHVKQQLQAVWKAAASLPERQRSVFLLRFVEDMDLLEIAAATGMKEGTVKVHLFRALRTVRERAGGSR
jgi:RNA polymerase sigma-70 factor (ECF subfamily)